MQGRGPKGCDNGVAARAAAAFTTVEIMESKQPPASEPALPSHRPAGRERLRNALDAALDGIAQALAAPRPSIECVRRFTVRFGALAREQALQLDEVVPMLMRGVRTTIDALPSPRRDEMLASVQWWAVHGYHRAD